MYFWNVNALKKQLQEGGLSEAQTFYYILAFVALSALAGEVITYFPPEHPDFWDYLTSVLSVAIQVIGTVMAYRVNRGAEGTQFAAKYFSIGLVMNLRFIVYTIPLALAVLAAYFLAYRLFPSGAESSMSMVLSFVFTAWFAALYARIIKHMRDTVQASRAIPVEAAS